MTLQFYDTTHTYELNGQIIPSVSEILRFLSREVYGNDAFKYQQDLAAERGTAVHKATVEIDETGQCEIDDCWAGYCEAYCRFVIDCEPEWHHSEIALDHSKLGYAGTPDRYGMITVKRNRKQERVCATVDIKTTATVHKTLVKAQLNGYYKLEVDNWYSPNALYCLQLLPTGKYRLYPVAIDDSEFMWCYGLHYSMKKKHGRGRID